MHDRTNPTTRILRDRKGAVAVIFALTAPVLIAFVTLGVEVGMWYNTRNTVKATADAAALAAVRELAAGNSSGIQDVVTLAATDNGCTAANDCSVDTPTTYKENSSAATDDGVQVTARTNMNLMFAGLFLTGSNGQIEISATAKAFYSQTSTTSSTTSTTSEPACILGLDNNAAYTVFLKNNVTLNCTAVSNSKCQGKTQSATCKFDATTYGSYSCSSSIDPQCNAGLTTTNLSSMLLENNAIMNSDASAAGLIYLSNNAKIKGTKLNNGMQSTDPYASVSLSTPTTTAAHTTTGSGTSGSPYSVSVAAGKCSTGAITYSNNVYINIAPGCYNGWDFKNNAKITLSAGTYYVKSKLDIQNNASITATSGTTIVIVGDYAMGINNNAILTITAPTSGTFQGIAFMGDPAGKATVVQTFSNNATLNIKGAVYFRNQILNLENNAVSGSGGCLQLIARRVLFSNNATIGTSCASIGTKDLTLNQSVTTTVTSTTTTVNQSQ